MADFLRSLLPRVLPANYALGVNVFIRSHQGKTHLQQSIRRKIKHSLPYYGRPVKLIVIQDQDANDCMVLKEELREAANNDHGIPVLIRIACRELENWYLGDMEALAAIYPGFKPAKFRERAKYRVVDSTYGAKECATLIPAFSKTEAANAIAGHMEELAANRSESFQQTISGIRNFLSTEEE